MSDENVKPNDGAARPSPSCGVVRPRLPMLAAAELLPADERDVREHLLHCVSCRVEFGGFMRARRALQTLLPLSLRAAGAGRADGAGKSTDPASDAFFDSLRRDTLAAVRAPRVRRRSRSRTSWAGMMTAAALFLIGVYLVPEPAPFRARPAIPTITAVTPSVQWIGPAGPPLVHDVGYGLMGHEVRPLAPVPLDLEVTEARGELERVPDPAAEPAPERDARAATRDRR